MVKLSVIIPYYNGEKWIAKCLDSLLHQDLGEDEYEIIVVDDGSTKSSEVLKNYVQSHQNIHYILQENKGVSAARNKGLSIAEGEFIFFCDCDDFITEDVLGRLYDIAKSNDVDLLFL
jgi:glycosyltransferase involved in cell wall biosynthesis